MRQMRQRLFRRRINNLLALAAVAGVDPFAIDIESEIAVHEVLT